MPTPAHHQVHSSRSEQSTNEDSPRRRRLTEDRTGPSDTELKMIRTTAHDAALRSGAGPADADDIAQVVTERFWRNWRSPPLHAARRQGPTFWRNYVARSARNALVDQARAAERRWRREMRAADPAARIPRPRRPGTLTGTTTPTAGRIEDYQARVEIAQLIVRRLSGRRRLVAWRTLIDGWTTREIAEDLGLPSRTVRHLRTEAIRQIRAALSC